MRRQLLFVFGSQTCVPDDALFAAQRLGCRTTIFAAGLPCGVSGELINRYERVSLKRLDQVVDWARRLHSVDPIHGVVGYDDQAVPAAARIAADLGLPGNPVEAADATRDKLLMKERFAAGGVPIAPYHLAADEDDAVAWAGGTGFPVVVKPLRGSASQGVMRADDEDELRQAYRRLRRIVRDYGLDTGGRPGRVQLVERYLEGDEVSVELLIRDGVPRVICLFEKPRPLQGKVFEETIYVTPSRRSAAEVSELGELAGRAVRALGLTTGVAHCELRISSAGPRVLEVAGRAIGGACSRVFRVALGEEIHPYIARLALGEAVKPPGLRPGAAGAMMLPIPGEGRLVAVRGTDRAAEVPGIQDVLVTARPGDAIVPFPEQSCYVGFLTARGETPEEVAEVLERAAGRIDLDLAPLRCLTWSCEIDGHRDYRPPPHFGIRTLEGCDRAGACEAVLPLVAEIHFGELPDPLAIEEARHCVRWLEEGNRGETSPAFWLVSEGRGVALGSYREETCYVSCLGVVPGERRSGLGEALVKSTMALFAARGCRRIEGPIDPRQPGSNGLARRLGFVVSDGSDEAACCSC